MLKNGKKEGIGFLHNPEDQLIYEGEFQNDLKHGYGIQYFSKRFKYEGIWINGKIEKFHYFIQCIIFFINIFKKIQEMNETILLLIMILIILQNI